MELLDDGDGQESCLQIRFSYFSSRNRAFQMDFPKLPTLRNAESGNRARASERIEWGKAGPQEKERGAEARSGYKKHEKRREFRQALKTSASEEAARWPIGIIRPGLRKPH